MTQGTQNTQHTAKYNSEARQYDVVNGDGEIVAMFGGGNKGLQSATRYAASLNAVTGQEAA